MKWCIVCDHRVLDFFVVEFNFSKVKDPLADIIVVLCWHLYFYTLIGTQWVTWSVSCQLSLLSGCFCFFSSYPIFVGLIFNSALMHMRAYDHLAGRQAYKSLHYWWFHLHTYAWYHLHTYTYFVLKRRSQERLPTTRNFYFSHAHIGTLNAFIDSEQ